jgi:hypothetical protein
MVNSTPGRLTPVKEIQAQLPSSLYLVGNTWYNHEQHLAETAAAHFKISKELLQTQTQVFT